MRSKVGCYFVLLLFIFMSCSNPVAPIEGTLSVNSMNDQLKITNNSNKTLYLFIVERETAALINWVPLFGDPKVLKYDSIFIDYSEIYKGSEESVKSGDEVIIYYWDDSNKSRPEVYSIVVTL